MSDLLTYEHRRGLVLRIARCPIISQHVENGGEPCGEVIDEQWMQSGRPRLDGWQAHHLAPEPWSGHIDRAPILFVASNPSLGSYQARLDAPPPTGYPTVASSDSDTENYFDDRFDGRIVDGIRNRGDTTIVRFWRGVLRIAADLMPEHVVRPGLDYALTELVRCKSKGERGVRHALATCTTRYFDATLEASVASVVVATGAVARGYFRSRPELRELRGRVSPPVQIAGRERRIAIVPHPTNQRGLKYLISEVAPESIDELREVVAAVRPER
jgi:hypothetical protein